MVRPGKGVSEMGGICVESDRCRAIVLGSGAGFEERSDRIFAIVVAKRG